MANQQQNQAPKKLSASERIERLEGALMNTLQTMDNMARDLLILKDAVKLLGNKVDAVVKLLNSQEALSDVNIAKVMTQNNIEELAGKVKMLVDSGVLAKVDALPAERGFVVGKELNEAGEVQNPRIQFTMHSQPKEVQDKLVGAKAGDVLQLSEGKAKLEVTETYEIKLPGSEEAQQTETPKQ